MNQKPGVGKAKEGTKGLKQDKGWRETEKPGESRSQTERGKGVECKS